MLYLNGNQKYRSRLLKFVLMLTLLIALPIIYVAMLPIYNPINILEIKLYNICQYLILEHTYNPFTLIFVFLNHAWEKIMNLPLLLTINISAVIYYKDRRKAGIFNILFAMVAIQVVYQINHQIASNLLEIKRASPSLVFDGVRISELYGSRLKDYSYSSFPGDHALVFFFWAFVTSMYMDRKMRIFVVSLATFLSLPRVFGGSHWLSDVAFSAFEAYCFYYLIVLLSCKIGFLRKIQYQKN